MYDAFCDCAISKICKSTTWISDMCTYFIVMRYIHRALDGRTCTAVYTFQCRCCSAFQAKLRSKYFERAKIKTYLNVVWRKLVYIENIVEASNITSILIILKKANVCFTLNLTDFLHYLHDSQTKWLFIYWWTQLMSMYT